MTQPDQLIEVFEKLHTPAGLSSRLEERNETPLIWAVSEGYLAYQSSDHCATLFATSPVTLTLSELIPNFDGLDARIRALSPPSVAQPASSIVRTDGLSLHRADAASGAGWRIWIRSVETDREVQLDSSIIDCYGTVFRPAVTTS